MADPIEAGPVARFYREFTQFGSVPGRSRHIVDLPPAKSDNGRMTVLRASETSVLVRIAANPERARAHKYSIMQKLSTLGKQIARTLMNDADTSDIPAEAKNAARAVRYGAARPR